MAKRGRARGKGKGKQERRRQQHRSVLPAELRAKVEELVKRGAKEVANVDAFAFPLPPGEDCPLCFVPIGHMATETNYDKTAFLPCCGKTICKGCAHLQQMHQYGREELQDDILRCPFCRASRPDNFEAHSKAMDLHMQRGNPHAFLEMGRQYHLGNVVQQNEEKALEMFMRAAELGLALAWQTIIIWLLVMFEFSSEEADICALTEISAKKGNVISMREYGLQQLGKTQDALGNTLLAFSYVKLAASAGDQQSLNMLMGLYREEAISKEVIDEVMRAFQEYTNTVKSKDRDEAVAWMTMSDAQQVEYTRKFRERLRQS